MNAIRTINFSFFRLDGGAMFGSVPKNLWSKIIPVDSENCIPLASRSMLIEQDDKKILIDCGLGSKWDKKSEDIYGIKNFSFEELSLDPSSITHLVLTHLHFDHGGGISFFDDSKKLCPTFPHAQVFLQNANYENGKNPSLRERASYLKENVTIIESMNHILLSGTGEIIPGIIGHEVHGHTKGQQWIEILFGDKKYFFATDVVPTSRHLPLPYTMGYDICTETVMTEKHEFLTRALEEDAIVVFQHDPDLPAATITKNEKGHFCVKEKIYF